MSVINITKDNYNEVRDSSKKVLLDFYADWCGPCRMISPLVEEIARENPQYLIGKVNADSEPELAQAFAVSSIPTLVVMQNGKIITQSPGVKNKESIIEMLEK